MDRLVEPGPTAAVPIPAVPAALLEDALALEMPVPRERAPLLGWEAGLAVDALLARVARGSGALAIAIGDGLAALSVGDRVLRLGYSGVGDYARERLGVAGRTAQAMARLARELRERPLLREAVRRGEVSERRAQAVLPVAVGDAEARWVERARSETVRALEAAVREARGAPRDDEEAWETFAVSVSPAAGERLDQALDLAGRKLGAASPRWERVQAICQEYLGHHPADGDAGVADDLPQLPTPASEGARSYGDGNRWLDPSGAPGGGLGSGRGRPREPALPEPRWLEELKAGLEAETRRWADLGAVEPVPAPDGAGDECSPRLLDARLRELAAMRDRWDELLGHLGMLMQALGLWRHIGFATFGQYCQERLGMCERAVAQRAWLERRLAGLPALRRAMRDGRVSYEKARVVAGRAEAWCEEAWIAVAERIPCIELRRRAEDEEDAQMCAHPEVVLRLPASVAELLEAATEAAWREARREGRWISPSERLERVAAHFVQTYAAELASRATPSRRTRERDRGLCQVPGCSRCAAHAHHIVSRARGGSDDPENLVALCAAHHLHGVHRGWVRVRGRAPDMLVWELGEPEEELAAAA